MTCRRPEAAEPSPRGRGRAAWQRADAGQSNLAGTQARRAVATLAVLALISACSLEDTMPAPAEGERYFAQNCTACHGPSGAGGDTIGLRSAPDLTGISTRAGGNFPRAQVLSQIDGYSRGKSPAHVMPEFGSLLEGELVPVEVDGVLTPTPRPLAALLAYLEAIQVE